MENLGLKGLKGLYDSEILEVLERGEIERLKELIPEHDREKREVMEPLLYAVKKDKHTYAVYQQYGPGLQRAVIREQKELAVDIIMKEPEVIEGTAISMDQQFILDYVESKPEIIRYINPQLKENDQFINELNNKENLQVISEVARMGLVAEILNNSELSNDKEYMSSVIKNDATFLEYASKELRNDGEFLKKVALQNEEIINYVSNNSEKFGLKGIEGVREGSTEYIISNEEYAGIVDDKAKKEKRYKNAQEKIESYAKNGEKGTATFVTAAVMSQSDKVSEEFTRRTVNYAILTMEAIKKDLSENGEMKLDLDTRKQRRLITPVVLDRLSKSMKEQGISLDEELMQKIDEYKNFYNEYMSQVREQNKKEHPRKNFSIENVRRVTAGAIPDRTIGEVGVKEKTSGERV